jgi:tetratricopeptide (TPR) repeat protein
MQGKRAAADAQVAELRSVAATRRVRAVDHLARLAEGRLALQRREYARAVEILSKVDSELRPRVAEAPYIHATVWDALAQAQIGAGDRAGAAKTFQRLADSRMERVTAAIEAVRSHYFLGQLAEQAGDAARARQHYDRFLSYWKNADIDRERVAEALKKTALPRHP